MLRSMLRTRAVSIAWLSTIALRGEEGRGELPLLSSQSQLTSSPLFLFPPNSGSYLGLFLCNFPLLHKSPSDLVYFDQH